MTPTVTPRPVTPTPTPVYRPPTPPPTTYVPRPTPVPAPPRPAAVTKPAVIQQVDRKPLSKPPRGFTVTNRAFVVEQVSDISVRNLTINKRTVVKQVKKVGPEASRFNSTVDRGFKKFKDGGRETTNDKICRRRYTLLYVTALGNVPVTVPENFVTTGTSPTRVLQALPTTNSTTTTTTTSSGPK